MIHYFKHNIENITLPSKFTYPFHYTPHPLSVIASKETMEYIKGMDKKYSKELQKGKMFGVLIVRNKENRIGYLAAFSGNINGENEIPFFVPPVYNLLNPDGYFKKEEKKISNINSIIKEIEGTPQLKELEEIYKIENQKNNTLISSLKENIKSSKKERDKLRATTILSKEDNDRLIKESQFQKAELKRAEKKAFEEISSIQEEINIYKKKINDLKDERKNRSAQLQQYLFSQFRFLNIKGEEKDLCDIFNETVQKEPPAGSGECAAPKLLQYAFKHELFPIAMAEFWWGDSPKGLIRHHGDFYPSCLGKCKPILSHMLNGMDIDDNPLNNCCISQTPEIVFEDDYLLVLNKPAGMLSVPGRESNESALSFLENLYKDKFTPYIVHRLDMATSGLLLFAKNMEVYKMLQQLFIKREIKKRYIAIVSGEIAPKEGVISLPLMPDFLNRPRQIVDIEKGKNAITNYKVIEYIKKDSKNYTRLALFPHTGRTHQLRVHCAHSCGLNSPILGDELYGTKAERLYLHAEYLEFKHPITGECIKIKKEASF